MKEEILMTVYSCDNCGERLTDGNDHVGYIDEDIWDVCDHGWIEHEGKHYCPNCYAWDDDDNLIIKHKDGKI